MYRFHRAPSGQLETINPGDTPDGFTADNAEQFSAAASASGEQRGASAVYIPRRGDFLAQPEDLERLAVQQLPLRDSPTCITSGAFDTELCALDQNSAIRRGGSVPSSLAARAAEVELGGWRAPDRASPAADVGPTPNPPVLPGAWPGGSLESGGQCSPIGSNDQVVVIIRHGKTEHNKLGLFTGWEDVPLATEGALEAMAAGRLLAEQNVCFDVVYTSWLSRSISTAWLVLEQLDALWLPIVKSWRLNERMYGALTSLSKRMIRTKYGQRQFQQWRRGYTTRPPPVSSFSPMYPGNDERYVLYVDDVRNSVRESVIRSIEAGRLQLHPKLPKSESLRDCMERTIPFWRWPPRRGPRLAVAGALTRPPLLFPGAPPWSPALRSALTET